MEKTTFSKIWKLFTLSFIIFFCSASVLSASAQNGRITLDMKQVPLEQTMNAIEKQTSYLFVNKDVLITQKVSITVTNASIDQTLKLLFKDRGINYRIDQRSIFISKAKAVDNTPVTISGKVVDVNGIPIIGAAVVVKGTTVGTRYSNGYFMPFYNLFYDFVQKHRADCLLFLVFQGKTV